MVSITVTGDHDRPEWLIRINGIRNQARIDPARPVFIDETWTKTNMAPLRGWRPIGDRLLGKAPYGYWGTGTR